MATIDLPVQEDCFICTNSANWDTNFGNHNFYLTNGSYEWRTLIRPNFSSLPASAVISAVSLFLCNEAGPSASRTDSFYRLRRMWVELQATGHIWKTGSNWSTIGAENTSYDRYSTLMGTITIPYPHSQIYYSCSLSVSEFDALRSLNTGILIKRTGGNLSDGYYRSSQYTGSAPYFRVTYTLPAKRQGVIWFM